MNKPHDIGRNKAKREARARGSRHIGKAPRFYHDNGKQNTGVQITHGGRTWLAIDNTGSGARECERRAARG
jgi:hypothetical protein